VGNRNSSGYTTGSENEMTNDGTWTYSYDGEGNLTKKSKGTNAETWTYGYDNDNHMVWAKDSATDGGAATTLATYVYDALGNRIEKDVWTGSTAVTRFGYDGDEVWVDLTSGNALQTRYIHGDAIDELFARVSSAGTAAWYLTDRLSSIRDIVNGSGSVIDHIDYDGFGNATETQPGNGDRYKWTGREFDAETGFDYNRARYLDLHAGRWQSQDPLGVRAGDTNFYRYVFNNPLKWTDPSGLAIAISPSLTGLAGASPQLILTVAEALTGAAVGYAAFKFTEEQMRENARRVAGYEPTAGRAIVEAVQAKAEVDALAEARVLALDILEAKKHTPGRGHRRKSDPAKLMRWMKKAAEKAKRLKDRYDEAVRRWNSMSEAAKKLEPELNPENFLP
jgi:RHS repeat-associated protein